MISYFYDPKAIFIYTKWKYETVGAIIYHPNSTFNDIILVVWSNCNENFIS
jgi:hypothetical protein